MRNILRGEVLMKIFSMRLAGDEICLLDLDNITKEMIQLWHDEPVTLHQCAGFTDTQGESIFESDLFISPRLYPGDVLVAKDTDFGIEIYNLLTGRHVSFNKQQAHQHIRRVGSSVKYPNVTYDDCLAMVNA